MPTIICGSTIDSIAAAGTNQATATQINRYSKWDVILVSGVNPEGVRLPSAAEVGDLIEIHCDSGFTGLNIWPSSGDQIMYGGANNGDSATHVLYRYVSAGNWLRVTQ